MDYQTFDNCSESARYAECARLLIMRIGGDLRTYGPEMLVCFEPRMAGLLLSRVKACDGSDEAERLFRAFWEKEKNQAMVAIQFVERNDSDFFCAIVARMECLRQ